MVQLTDGVSDRLVLCNRDTRMVQLTDEGQ